ncbi:MAG: HAD-IB family phosphatase [Parachlamydia sp.]|nr:HAD-IB family phosphatase [Parachlamydia sp.]
MATVVFDFDSTLVTCESMEEMARSKVDAATLQEVQAITRHGMSGEIDFLASLKKRLSLVALTRDDCIHFAERAYHYLTPGMAQLIADLQAKGIAIWVVSGACREILLPIGRQLQIPEEHLLGINLKWSPEGGLAGIDEALPINRSKWEGAQAYSRSWTSPIIAVGDGVTDYALYEHGLADHFIAFTQNARRSALLDKGVAEARSVKQLRELLM